MPSGGKTESKTEEEYYEMDLVETDLDPRGYLTLQALAIPSEGYGIIT